MDSQWINNVVQAALQGEQVAFARQTTERWLREQPGHLTMSVLLARALLADDALGDAGRMLRGVLLVDPESEAALALSIQLYERLGHNELAWAAASALGQVSPDDRTVREKMARIATRAPKSGRKSLDEEMELFAVIPALIKMEDHWRNGELELAQSIADEQLQANPALVKAHLIVADCMMSQGDQAEAVAHIHQSASLDPGGEVAQRLWDGKLPYPGAWPSMDLVGTLGPLPHPVAAALGMNLLEKPGNGKVKRSADVVDEPPSAPAESVATKPPPITMVDETLISIQTEINRLNGRQKSEPDSEGITWVRLKPVYAILASKGRLEAKYGTDGLEQINSALQALAGSAESRLQLPSGVLYLDDADNLATFQLDPVDPADPSAVKSLINQLDSRLAEHEQELGWVLLVGGGDMIAFHRLPNPTDDGDTEVLSDNPYGCRDENYFVPQRVVGRLPDGDGDDPTSLLKGISAALAAHHADRRVQKEKLQHWWEYLLWLLGGRKRQSESSFGYSASVWRKASLTVFTKIGPARRLRISPPLTAGEFSGLTLGPARYGYFNLHGIADGPNWYGQRDPTFPADYPAFPVALRPQDVGTMGSVPEVVFSEACYGAYLEGKTAETALSLKFLASGAKMFVGSTCIAYGGLNSKPEAADLLASFFWKEILAGRSGGVAFQQAKVAFAEYLDKRQGYLDGEEQKTLISFVYYGDPTLTAPPALYMVKKLKKTSRSWKELIACPPTVCAKGMDSKAIEVLSPELVNQIRSRVAGYLPGMEDANFAVAQQRKCAGKSCDRQCETCLSGAKSLGAEPGDKLVFTLQKSAQVAGKTHDQVVKVTVDNAGQMYKLTVSK